MAGFTAAVTDHRYQPDEQRFSARPALGPRQTRCFQIGPPSRQRTLNVLAGVQRGPAHAGLHRASERLEIDLP